MRRKAAVIGHCIEAENGTGKAVEVIERYFRENRLLAREAVIALAVLVLAVLALRV